MKLVLPLLYVLTAVTSSVSAQFTCTLSASDEESCLAAEDDDGEHCVWCALSSFGFCLNEAAAEAAEQTLPSITCDRNKDTDDDKPNPSDDDSVKPSDDDVSPTDDSLPDDYWKCLKKKDSKTCDAEDDCVWCNSKGGWGLCMSGPTAESAAESDFFQCDKKDDPNPPITSSFADPYDSSCVQSYLQDPTEEGCVATNDADGSPCKWCSLAGMTNMCLTEEQADMGSQLGVTCDDSSIEDEDTIFTAPTEHEDDNNNYVQDPLDPSCIVAYLQDQTQEACAAATDQDGNPCEWCSFQSMNLCLTNEQAAMGQQAGVTCDSNVDTEDQIIATKYIRG